MANPMTRDDDRDLARAGYRPRFRRGLGSFAAFAVGFSYLSILTGVFQNFHLGYREAGPAFVWTWPAVFAGQFCLALCFAELAREYPYCGGVYAWGQHVGPPVLGWLTGWVYLASLVVTLAAVALAWQITLPVLWSGFQLVESPAQNAAILGVVLVAVSTALNTAGTRWLAALMNVGVVVELVAAVVLVVLLAVRAVRGPDVFLHPPSVNDADGFGSAGAFLAAAVMAAYVMYGFDTAGTLAEETVDPRVKAPRAILRALAAAGVLGLLLLLTAVAAAPDPLDPLLSQDIGGLPHLVKQVLGDPVGTVFVGASAVAVFICTLAVQANASRVLFAMARDRAVPGWRMLSWVHPGHQSPLAAALAIGAAGAMLLLVYMDHEQVVTTLVCVSIVWANLAYLLTIGPLLVTRVRGQWPMEDARKERIRRIVNAVAVVWGVALIVNIGWPRERFYGAEWHTRFAAPLFTAGLLASGLIVYRFVRPAACGRPGRFVEVTSPVSATRRFLGWCVHAYTATGLLLAAGIASLLVQSDRTPDDYRYCFLLMLAAVVVDGTDGTLARAVRIREAVPGFDGRRLDDLIDFLTYTCLPLLLIDREGLLPNDGRWALLFALVASAYGFCQTNIKTADGAFVGFPSYWNVVAYYLYRIPVGEWIAVGVVLAFAVLTFAPTRYPYPTQPGRANRAMLFLGVPWGALVLADVLHPWPDRTGSWEVWASVTYPATYLGIAWVSALKRLSVSQVGPNQPRCSVRGRYARFCLLLAASWCAMTFTHESGHVLGGWFCGGTLREAKLMPWELPYSVFDPDPQPLNTLWSGPLLGVLLPLAAAALVRRPWTWFVAYFCVLANGSYIAIAWVTGDQLLDTPKLLRHGAHPATIAVYCAVTIVVGYVGFRNQCVRVLTPAGGKEGKEVTPAVRE